MSTPAIQTGFDPVGVTATTENTKEKKVVEFSSSKKEALKQALEQVRHLQGLSYHNTEFKGWLDRTTASIKAEYGDDSREARRFINAAGRAFVVGTETGKEQEYQRQLDCYEEVLRSLLGME